MLELLEPWCDRIYVDNDRMKYITMEQPKTSFDLNKRVHDVILSEDRHHDDILVTIDGHRFDNNDFRIIQTLPEIFDNDDQIQEMIMVEPTHFEIENLLELC